jgi:CelD/BcsL family acetyltransferase involved in cellulose biosynthesis
MGLFFERLDFGQVDWGTLDAFPDRLVYQTREWVTFVAETQHADPVVARIHDDDNTAGYFTGLVQRRIGLAILGSPMPGWTTAFMGFNLGPGASRRAALQSLTDFAFRELRCVHVEVHDRFLSADDLGGIGYTRHPWTGVEVDLGGSEDEVWSNLKSTCRTAIRKASRHGVIVEVADDYAFADDFYGQLVDVFAKQALVPPYGVGRIRELIRIVHPTGRLLLMRARNASGECIATGIFPAMKGRMHFLAGASLRGHQDVRPNEALMWAAMMYWKRRGVEVCDLGGFMSYKRKWGGVEIEVSSASASRLRGLSFLRDVAQRAHATRQAARGRIRKALRTR